jgi:hypothetical protein
LWSFIFSFWLVVRLGAERRWRLHLVRILSIESSYDLLLTNFPLSNRMNWMDWELPFGAIP